MLVFPGRRFSRASNQAEETEDGTYQIAAKLGRDSANSESNQSSPEPGLLRLCELCLSVELALNGDQRVEQG